MKIQPFQIRWNEALGIPECPYLRRWVLVLFGFSIRLHHWIRSDDHRHFHDHPFSFVTVVLKGSYVDVAPALDGVGEVRETLKAGQIKFRKAEHRHYVSVPKNGAWTLLFCSQKKRNWGFWIKGTQFFRPLRYFSRYGHLPCE